MPPRSNGATSTKAWGNALTARLWRKLQIPITKSASRTDLPWQAPNKSQISSTKGRGCRRDVRANGATSTKPWGNAPGLPANEKPWQILVSIAVALPFVFISRAMLPREQDTWPSLDEYYIAHRRVLLAVLLIPPLVSISYNCALANFPDRPEVFYDVIRLGVPILLILWPRRLVQSVGLAALIINMVARLFM